MKIFSRATKLVVLSLLLFLMIIHRKGKLKELLMKQYIKETSEADEEQRGENVILVQEAIHQSVCYYCLLKVEF